IPFGRRSNSCSTAARPSPPGWAPTMMRAWDWTPGSTTVVTTTRAAPVTGYEVLPMILVDLKSLVSHLNSYCTKSLEWAAGTCLSRTHYEITVEHLLAGLMEDQRSDIPLILHASGIDAGQVRRGIDHAIESFKTGNAAKPVFSPMILELIQDAWLISSV